MTITLTAGAIPIISNGRWNKNEKHPVVQVTNIWNASFLTHHERYELTLSDGSFYRRANLSVTHNLLIRSQQLQKTSIIQLTSFNSLGYKSPIDIKELNVILVNYSNIIGDPKPYPSPKHEKKQQERIRAMELRRRGILSSTTNESVTMANNNPEIHTVKEELEEFPKGPKSKKLKTSQSSSDEEGKPASASINKRGPTIDECVDKLKGLDLKATDPLYLAAFCIFSQRDNSRESWMKLPSEAEVLKGWIKMMAKMKGIMK